MDKTLIYQAIEHPHLRKNISIEELERIQSAYPYFATAHVLLAKLYQEQNDHRFADQLQQAAVYVTDRHVLYDYLHDETEIPTNAPLPEAPVIIEEEAIEEVAEVAVKEVALQVEEEPVEEVVEEAIAAEEPLVLVVEKEEETALVEQIEEETEEETEEEIEAAFEDKEAISLESSVRRAVSAAFDEMKDFEEKIETEEVEKSDMTPHRVVRSSEMDSLERNILIEAIHSSIEQEVEAEEELEENEPEIAEDLAVDSLLPKSYAQLMMERAERHQRQKQDGTPQELEKKEVKKLADPMPTISPRMEKTPPRDLQKSLIDKFIREQPKITPGKASEYINQQNLGKDSLEEDFSVVTETMAKLFAAQGKIDKARKVYRQLIALHPEKSIYFAAQLKNLNQNKKI